MVRGGMESQVIESILLNAAFANDVDLLESLLVIDRAILIEMLRSSDVTREMRLSYFSFNLQNSFRKIQQDLKMNFSEPLDMKEVK